MRRSVPKPTYPGHSLLVNYASSKTLVQRTYETRTTQAIIAIFLLPISGLMAIISPSLLPSPLSSSRHSMFDTINSRKSNLASSYTLLLFRADSSTPLLPAHIRGNIEEEGGGWQPGPGIEWDRSGKNVLPVTLLETFSRTIVVNYYLGTMRGPSAHQGREDTVRGVRENPRHPTNRG